MSSWKLTDLEFKVLCNMHLDGELPEPLTYTSNIRWLDEYERACLATKDDLARRMDREFETIIDAFARPTVVVGAQAWDDGDFDNPQKWVRVHAGRRGSRAYTVVQEPGATLDHAAGFTISSCDPRGMGEAVMALMPAAAAGTRGPIPIDIEPVSSRPVGGFGYGSMVADDEDDRGFTGSQFLDQRSDSTGTIQVVQGRSMYGPRGITRGGRLWRDLPGDGRYVMELHHAAPVAVGMSGAALAEWVDGEIERILERMDDLRELDDWR
ncbi:ESX secretion-associated protein EspG [Nocardia higoensis]|uniref:ESX secretion-associated protein EspG n=1 Tax=Nocardia higoensis TaxID=228599 RepID=UPI00030F387E|nr:ESX secretion-associated protein EspG [Nocardia higoensis]